jgi:hypothetical protein
MKTKDYGRPRPRRKAKAVLHAAFHGWKDDEPAALAKRIDDLRHITAGTHRFNDGEWRKLDRMRDKMLANARAAKVFKEARRV